MDRPRVLKPISDFNIRMSPLQETVQLLGDMESEKENATSEHGRANPNVSITIAEELSKKKKILRKNCTNIIGYKDCL